jgi:hypothetical protein
LPDLTALPGNRGKRLGINVNFLFSALMNSRTRSVQAMETIRLRPNKASRNKPAQQAQKQPISQTSPATPNSAPLIMQGVHNKVFMTNVLKSHAMWRRLTTLELSREETLNLKPSACI